MDLILERTRADGQVSFSHLFDAQSPRGEVIVTFLALLELLRQHRIIVYQNAAFVGTSLRRASTSWNAVSRS